MSKENRAKKPKKIVCIGGGTGVSVLISGLKRHPVDLAVVVTMFDNGGSSGKLRKKLGSLPLGDIRQCLTVSASVPDFSQLFQRRFNYGDIKGHNVGNLLIDEICRLTGSLDKAIDELRKNLNIKTKILPVTLDKRGANIEVILKNDKKIIGEEEIINNKNLSRVGVKSMSLVPEVKANTDAVSAIKDADLIIIGPGKLYTSLIPNFLVRGIKDAILKSRAKKVFICNLMTQAGNTDRFSVEDFVNEIEKYTGKGVIDYIVFNTGKLPPDLMKEINEAFPGADFVKYDKKILKKKNFIGEDLLDRRIRKLNPADTLVKGANQRTMIFHDSEKLTSLILKLCK